MSYRLRRNLVMAVVAAGVIAAAFWFASSDERTPVGVTGLAPAGSDPFGDGDLVANARRGVLSPSGADLVVLTPGGLGLVERNRIRPVTDVGTKVVDVAWFGNGATVLVAEGPVPTGLLAVVDIDGRVRGSVPLAPSIGFGTGHGMAVAPGGKQAVVTAVDRPALGEEQRWVVVVDLETGATRGLTTPGGPDEHRPFYLDSGRVAFTETDSTGSVRTVSVDVASGETEEVAAGAYIVGVTDSGRPVVAKPDGSVGVVGKRIGGIPDGTALTSLHPASGVAVVVETVDALDGTRSTRLRRVELDPTN